MSDSIRSLAARAAHALPPLSERRPRDGSRGRFELGDEPRAEERPESRAELDDEHPAPPANDDGVGRRVDFTA